MGRRNLAGDPPAAVIQAALGPVLALVALTAGQVSTVDLAEILAGPPSADYADVASSAYGLSGPFTAHQYALWLARTQSEASGYENTFNQEGFTRGYGRTWAALSTTKASPGSDRHNWLIETVEEYTGAAGAQSRYDGVEAFTRGGGDDFVHDIKTSIPHAFGALIFSGRTYFVMILKGNDVYIVRMESDLDDMTAAVVQQAQVQFNVAPAYTIAPGQSTPANAPASNRGFNRNAVVYGVILLATMAAGGVVILVGRRLSG